MKGKLIIFSGPSGSGKSTLIQKLRESGIIEAEFSVSATSRVPRENEIHKEHYYFMTPDIFQNKIANEEFIEWEEVYENQFYGTLKSDVERIRNSGKHVLFDIDAVGGKNIKSMYQEQAFSIFVKPPSLEILKERLINRSTEDSESLTKRLAKAEYELSYAQYFDFTLVNDNLDEAFKTVKSKILNFVNESPN